MINYKKLSEDIHDIVAQRLHYFERVNDLNLNIASAQEVINLAEGGRSRYHTDYRFKQRVRTIAAAVLQAVRQSEQSPEQVKDD
jgi:hypothetical protein